MIDADTLGTQAEFKPARPTSEADRVAAAKLMLMKLGLNTDDPRWSSDQLERLLKSVTEAPDGSVGDLVSALFEVLGEYSPELSKPVASFIKDLVVICFTRDRRSYESVNWKQLAERLSSAATKAQLYLALHALPATFVPARLAHTIAEALRSTAFCNEVVSALAS